MSVMYELKKLNDKVADLEHRVQVLEILVKTAPPRRRGPRSRTYDLWYKIQYMHFNGMNQRNIAELYGISYSTVQRYMHMPESEALKLPREIDMKPKRRRKYVTVRRGRSSTTC